MKKRVGIIKKLFILFLVFLLSINNFAAVVSDNDGSAFITKSEFDALKSSFQSQIDTYNQSIDSKIDGAIASYLAGIKITNTQTLENYIGKLNNNSNLPYKYWTDTLKIGVGAHAKYGYYGGFWSVNYIQDIDKTGSFWGRLSALGASSDMAFNWTYPSTYVREKVYMIDSFQGNKYLTGDAKEYHVYRGFVMSGGATTAYLGTADAIDSDYMDKTADHDSSKCLLQLRFYEDIANVEDWNTGTTIDSFGTTILNTTHWSIWNTKTDTEINKEIIYSGAGIHSSSANTMSLCVFNLTQEYTGTPHAYLPRLADKHVPMFLTPAKTQTVCLDINDIEKAKVQTGNELSVNCGGRTFGAYIYKNNAGNIIAERYANTNANSYNTIKYKFPQHLTQDVNVADLIDYDETLARGIATKGTEGALVCINNSGKTGTIDLTLKFVSRTAGFNQNVKFALRNEPFTTATQLSSNVDTTYSTWTQPTYTEIPIKINVAKNEEIWIQLAPETSGNFVGVEVVGDIKFTVAD